MIDLQPNNGELPSSYADRLGLLYASNVTVEDKRIKGQFFTPLEVAKFMAEFTQVSKRKIRILDPGCGIGILSCALAEFLKNQNTVVEIDLMAFETDVNILPFAEKVYSYLREWLGQKEIIFNHFLCANDFILHNSSILANSPQPEEQFDIIIANPPYFKISKTDSRALAAKDLIYGQTNIYSIFMVISAKLLASGGQLIFITPRSFSSGNYFRVFRTIFFSITLIRNIHLFHSRRSTFKRDKILLENVIISAFRRNININSEQLNLDFIDQTEKVTISVSAGVSDLENRVTKNYNLSELVNLSSQQKILHIPTSEVDENAIKIFKTWEGSLRKYDLDISTGPVVDFRSLDFISDKKKKKSVPLFWLHNVHTKGLNWPSKGTAKGKAKGNYIIMNEKSLSRLVDNQDMIFLRRFSSKEDKSKLVACPYLKSYFPTYLKVGIENHLNYIYHIKGKPLDIRLLFGLTALLNSKIFDIYFRTFNGNINVSATELRDLPLPSRNDILTIGGIVQAEGFNLDKLNNIISTSLNIDLVYDDATSRT